MSPALLDLLGALDRSGDLIDAALRQAPAPPALAAGLAEVLHALYPAAPLAACLLWDVGQPYAFVLEGGVERLERAEALARGTAPARALGLEETQLAVEEIVVGGERRALLGLAPPPSTPADTTAAVQTLLRMCGRHLALRLQLQQAQTDASVTWLADVGELAGPVLHEVNNVLNSLFLHVALLQSAASTDKAGDVTAIRQLRSEVTSLLGQFQQYRQRDRAPPCPVELNAVLRDAIAGLRREAGDRGRAIAWSAAADLPPVLGTATDLRRLFTFLLRNALAAGDPGGDVMVRTEATAARVFCRVEDAGPHLPTEALEHYFDPVAPPREGTNGLELAACTALVRRLKGALRCDNTAGGRVAVTVELPVAAK
jgi:signal transduction histidine kinase